MSKKLEVLNKFLAKLEDESNLYNWNSPENCNCGNLLQIIGVKKENIHKLIQTYDLPDEINSEFFYLKEKHNQMTGVYFYFFSLYQQQNIQCKIIKIPFTKVLNQLITYGFTLQELINLEHLKDERFNTNNFNYKDKDLLIQYVKNWINYEQSLVQKNKIQVQQSVNI